MQMGTDNQNSVITTLKNKITSYLKSFRLSFWFLITVFFLLGEWYSSQIFPNTLSIITLISLLGIFSSGSMINIVFDKKDDVFARKPIVKIFQYISSKEMIIAAIFMSFVSLLILYFFVNVNVFLLGFLIVTIGVIYSTPPIRLKTKPPFDCIMNATGGTIPFFVGLMVNSETLSFESFVYGFIIFLVILHTFFFFTTIDIESDKEMGMKTSCNMIGRKKSIISGIIIFIIGLSISFYYFGIRDIITISLLICIPIIFTAFKFRNKPRYLAIIVGGRSTSIFAGSILFLLSISSKNIFPIFFFVIWLILTIGDISSLLKIRDTAK